MRSSNIFLLVTIWLCASVAAAQEVPRPQDAWLYSAQNLTNDSLKDVKSLETLDGALVLGQLGALWWKTDPSQARKWLIQALNAVVVVPAKENPAEHSKRLAVARSLLSTISSTDQQLWDRLQAVLTSDETLSGADRTANADTLVAAALVVLQTDTRRAASLGSAALRVGLPTSLQHLLWGLRKRDAVLADQLFSQALAVARTTLDQEFLNSLRYAAFPELMGVGYDSSTAPPDAFRRELLLILADYLQQTTATLASKGIRDCGLAPASLQGLQVYFDKLQPQRADMVRQIVRGCEDLVRRPGVDSESESTGTAPTVDSLLAQADKTSDQKIKRPTYLAQAARLAANQKNFERAIKILDSMSDEERKFIGIWETWRRDWAVALAVQFVKRDDVGGMQQVIKTVPDPLRPFAMIYFVDKLPRGSYPQIAHDFLEESRKDLANADTPDLDKAYWYLMVVRLYSKFQFDSEAGEGFKNAISSLNRTRSDDSQVSGNLSDALTTKIIQIDFPVSLLESYPYLIKEAVSSINSVSRRARVRLDFIEISLKEFRSLAAKSSTEKKSSEVSPK